MGQTSATLIESKKPGPGEALAPKIIPGVGPGERAALYWVGLKTADGAPPFHAETLGGVTFMRHHTPPVGGTPGQTKRLDLPGYIARLTSHQIESLKAALARTVVRWRSREGAPTGRHGHLVTVPEPEDIEKVAREQAMTPQQRASYVNKARGFRFQEGDEPFAKWIYCVKVAVGGYVEGAHQRPSTTEPASVLETGIESP